MARPHMAASVFAALANRSTGLQLCTRTSPPARTPEHMISTDVLCRETSCGDADGRISGALFHHGASFTYASTICS